jgi:hypothetical protein
MSEGVEIPVELLFLVSVSVFLDDNRPSQVLKELSSEGIEGL